MRPGFSRIIDEVLAKMADVPAPPAELKNMSDDEGAAVAARMLAEIFLLAPDEIVSVITYAERRTKKDIHRVALEGMKPNVVMLASQMAMFFMGYAVGSKL